MKCVNRVVSGASQVTTIDFCVTHTANPIQRHRLRVYNTFLAGHCVGNWCPSRLRAYHPQLPGYTHCSDGPLFGYPIGSIRFESQTHSTTYRFVSPARFARLVSFTSWLFFWTLCINTVLVVLTNNIGFLLVLPRSRNFRHIGLTQFALASLS